MKLEMKLDPSSMVGAACTLTILCCLLWTHSQLQTKAWRGGCFIMLWRGLCWHSMGVSLRCLAQMQPGVALQAGAVKQEGGWHVVTHGSSGIKEEPSAQKVGGWVTVQESAPAAGMFS